ncbi:hypothetical protein B0H65DRAFT_476539 [Neurospora tetraspora]|uniref:Uncharacterized protein n=1 Tax=Neurospora tetraspora TaxID=94610 RepID=A0AAE0J9G4_9PEZI|nr:hypothetical protein B0H65DRAFT_476539 [Neurospora tetraspora]
MTVFARSAPGIRSMLVSEVLVAGMPASSLPFGYFFALRLKSFEEVTRPFLDMFAVDVRIKLDQDVANDLVWSSKTVMRVVFAIEAIRKRSSKVILDHEVAYDYVAEDNGVPFRSCEWDRPANAHQKGQRHSRIARSKTCSCAGGACFSHVGQKDKDDIALPHPACRVYIRVSVDFAVLIAVFVPQLIDKEAYGVEFETERAYYRNFEVAAPVGTGEAIRPLTR